MIPLDKMVSYIKQNFKEVMTRDFDGVYSLGLGDGHVDDQPHLIKKYEKIFRDHSISLFISKDAHNALNKIQSFYFDIILIDLSMPPGKWGGIWLLEQLRLANVQSPAIVISGEGTQYETIKTMELGAVRYILKEDLNKENLLEIIISDVKNNEKFILQNFNNKSFTTLCLLLKKYKNSKESRAKLKKIIEFTETAIKLTFFIGYCELLCNKGSVDKNIFNPKIPCNGISFGTWNQYRIKIKKYSNILPTFHSINKVFDEVFVKRTIEARNNLSHGYDLSDHNTDIYFNELKHGFKKLIKSIFNFWNFEIIFPISMEYDGSLYKIFYKRLVGESFEFLNDELYIEKPLISNHSYIKCNDILIDISDFILIKIKNNTINLYLYDYCESLYNQNAKFKFINASTGQRESIELSYTGNIQ